MTFNYYSYIVDCSNNNGGCEHSCMANAAEKWCSCRDGFEVSTDDWTKCADINECDSTKGVDYNQECHTCVNTIGSYTCHCRDGNELDPSTKQKCIGELCGGVDFELNCQICMNTKGSYACNCYDGYELQPDGKSCIGQLVVQYTFTEYEFDCLSDVHECKRGLYEVDCHTCVNLIGGHTCICNDTYVLDASNNNETCIG
ncbi:hypothetical protein CAPTEDRAFT_143354 [Capitella teleta]|uniref:EGF-like domain-containing protein n=1 Tax=Capitella teleta TaxID=283909 RepID=R7VE87_CAPTE|nr:hypothetical protein CAPTEDRAFT_143354 [Capitella teleta]|eukprot:ELU16944.1 hypothetical protein CAPTEDRAFT_143354 [Capitella teleta]